MANISTLTISGSNQYINITDHASAPSPTAGKLYANSTSIYWEDSDLAAGGGDAMDKVKSQGPTTDGTADGATGLANSSVLMESDSSTSVNILFNQGTAITGAYNTTLHIAGDCEMPGIAFTSDGTDGSQTFNDLATGDTTLTAQGGVHHDSGGSVSLRMSGAGYGDGTDAAYNALAINFDGTGDFIEIPTGDYITITKDEDFTIDMFLYPTTLGSDDGIYSSNHGNDNEYGITLHINDTNKLELRVSAAGDDSSSHHFRFRTVEGLTTNIWQHVAVDRINGVTRIYINGKPCEIFHTGGDIQGPATITKDSKGFIASYSDDGNQGISGVGAVIGRYYINTDNFYYIGYMDNFRFTRGFSRYKGRDFSHHLPILGRKITGNRGGEFTVRGQALYVGGGDDVSLADTGLVNRTGDDTTGGGLISVTIDAPQTVNSTAFMVPVTFKNTSDTQLTLNYNIWASVRANTATDDAVTSRMTHYGNRGIFFGGAEGAGSTPVNKIEYYTNINSSSEALDFGDATISVRAVAVASSGARVVGAGGLDSTPARTNVIGFITVASTGNATDFGDMTLARDQAGSNMSDGNRAVFAGGTAPTQSPIRDNTIDFITIGTTGDAINFGDLIAGHGVTSASSNGSRGVHHGGYGGAPGTAFSDIISYVSISTLSDSLDFGELLVGTSGAGSTNDASRAIHAGGGTPSNVDTIQYFNMSVLGNASDFGEMTQARRGMHGGASNGSRGLFAGGYVGPSSVDTIEYITIGTLGNATDYNELTAAREEPSATSGD